eukprot:g3528.t1
MGNGGSQGALIDEKDALPGRADEMPISPEHFVIKGSKVKEVPAGFETCVFASGCFWGAERAFWSQDGVYATSVGYIAGFTPNPTYKEVCSERTGHTEAVRVVWDPGKTTFEKMLAVWFEMHDPTQGMGQGNDRGTQYRSGVYPSTAEQKVFAERAKAAYGKALAAGGLDRPITSEVADPGLVFYWAEDYHQQYLVKPGARNYCSMQPTGINLPPSKGWPEGAAL